MDFRGVSKVPLKESSIIWFLVSANVISNKQEKQEGSQAFLSGVKFPDIMDFDFIHLSFVFSPDFHFFSLAFFIRYLKCFHSQWYSSCRAKLPYATKL